MQARVKFFMQGLVNETLTGHARQPLEDGRHHNDPIMRFSARARAGMAGVFGALIRQHKVNRRELRFQPHLHALSARKLLFVVCQFLVRLTLGAHTRASMSDAFAYRPKYVDIRVKKPDAETFAHEPSERPCDHIGCARAGQHRAPKSRDREGEYWHFCREHVSDYNRRWNYFAGMSDAELEDYQRKEETGHRPTWTFRGGRLDRFSAAMRGFQAGRRTDPFGMFGNGAVTAGPPPKSRRRLTRLQTLALEAMSLDENADAGDIRTRYAELVKRWHPDSNGGDRGAEANLQRVLRAYQTLKAGGLV